MTQSATTSFPAALGNAAVEGLARMIGRLLRLAWHNPINTAGLAIVAWGMTQGSVNALWMQKGPHPAPLFAQSAQLASAPATAPQGQNGLTQKPAAPALDNRTPTPSPALVQPAGPIEIPSNVGNESVARLQAKLQALGLFSGKVDGYYGPQTADAIRAFERRSGMPENGAISADVERAITQAPLDTAPAPARTGAAQPMPAPVPASHGVASTKDPIARIALSAAQRAVTPTRPEAQASAGAQLAPQARPAQRELKTPASTNVTPELVSMVQTGLARLGFFAEPVSGEFSPATARAIREFENYNNYPVTGKMAPELIDLLMSAGAYN